jgi:hypothetical protein
MLRSLLKSDQFAEAIPILANVGNGFQPSADRPYMPSIQYISRDENNLRMWYILDYANDKMYSLFFQGCSGK